MRARWWPIAVACAAMLAVPDGRSAGHEALPSSLSASDIAGSVSRNWEHRYRVDGKLWLLMYWMSRSDVGAARMSRQDDGQTAAITFLAGSNPERAPLSVNQWGYTRETTEHGQGRAFIIRTLDPRDPAEPEAHLADSREPSLFGASCGLVGGDVTQASVTGFRVEPNVTFRAMEQALEVARAARKWRISRVTTNAVVYPGLFSALQASLDESVVRTRMGVSDTRLPARIYSYRGELFELAMKKVEAAETGLLRAKFTYTKQANGEGGTFTVLFGADGETAGVPLEMIFQPAWWVRVSLRLDDSVDVPGGPAHDRTVSSRIDDICSRALLPELAGR